MKSHLMGATHVWGILICTFGLFSIIGKNNPDVPIIGKKIVLR